MALGTGLTLRQFLSRHLTVKPCTRADDFKFQKFVGRDDFAGRYCREVLIPRFKLWRRGWGDKTIPAAAYLFGPSGTGKSRTSHDLLLKSRDWLQQYVKQNRIDSDWQQTEPDHLQLAQDLLRLLGSDDQSPNWSVVLVDLHHNGTAIDSDEFGEWPTGIILGLRVAAKYFGVPVREIKKLSERNDVLKERFRLKAVIDAISEDICASAASPHVLHLAFDELHQFDGTMIPYEGKAKQSVQMEGASVVSSAQAATEPATTAFLRTVLGVLNEPRSDVFVVGTLAGTSLVPPLPSTTEKFQSYLLGSLSVENMMKIVEDEYVTNGTVRRDVFESDWFKWLIRALGGLPRLLELMPEVKTRITAEDKVLTACEAFVDAYADQYFKRGKFDPFLSRGMAPFVSISGVPVHRNALLSPVGSGLPITPTTLEAAGLVTLVEPELLHSEGWVARWGATLDVVLDMPLVLAWASIKYMSSTDIGMTCIVRENFLTTNVLISLTRSSAPITGIVQAACRVQQTRAI